MDPVLLFRIIFIQYTFGIYSMHQTIKKSFLLAKVNACLEY
ncbi:hypothetical protein [Lysinibacillus sp. LZ02]